MKGKCMLTFIKIYIYSVTNLVLKVTNSRYIQYIYETYLDNHNTNIFMLALNLDNRGSTLQAQTDKPWFPTADECAKILAQVQNPNHTPEEIVALKKRISIWMRVIGDDAWKYARHDATLKGFARRK